MAFKGRKMSFCIYILSKTFRMGPKRIDCYVSDLASGTRPLISGYNGEYVKLPIIHTVLLVFF